LPENGFVRTRLDRRGARSLRLADRDSSWTRVEVEPGGRGGGCGRGGDDRDCGQCAFVGFEQDLLLLLVVSFTRTFVGAAPRKSGSGLHVVAGLLPGQLCWKAGLVICELLGGRLALTVASHPISHRGYGAGAVLSSRGLTHFRWSLGRVNMRQYSDLSTVLLEARACTIFQPHFACPRRFRSSGALPSWDGSGR
jgi:hypothetical protein